MKKLFEIALNIKYILNKSHIQTQLYLVGKKKDKFRMNSVMLLFTQNLSFFYSLTKLNLN